MGRASLHPGRPVENEMAELVLLSLNRLEFNLLHKRACKGDESAVHAIESIWQAYNDSELECFLCGNVVLQRPIFTQVLPEHNDHSKLIAAPLCAGCRDLPSLVRLNRCILLLKKMYGARSGKQVHFTFAPRRR